MVVANVQPGQIALQCTPYGAQSNAVTFVNPNTACLEAQYPPRRSAIG